jgi:hypothetical protein
MFSKNRNHFQIGPGLKKSITRIGKKLIKIEHANQQCQSNTNK